MLLALGAEELHAPRSPAKTSDFESLEDGTRRKNAVGRSTPIALRMLPLEDNATAQFRRAGSEQVSQEPGYRVRRLPSTPPSLPTRDVTQRSLGNAIEWFGFHSHDYLPSSRARIAYLLLSQEQVYLRFDRNATFFMHFLAYLSYILANEPQESDEKGKGKRKKGSFRCSAILCEKAHPLNELGSVASYMRNQRRITDK